MGLVAQVVLQLETLGLCLAVLGLIGLGVFVGIKARAWYLEPDAPPAPTDDPLESYRELLEAGQLDPQEFEKIRTRLQTPNLPPDSEPRPPA